MRRRTHATFNTCRFLVCIAMVLAAVGAQWNAAAATFEVNTTLDTVDANPGDGVCADASGACSLRAAIQEANALAGADTINVPAGTYTLTISGRKEDFSATGDLDVTSDVIVQGADDSTTIIDGAELDRVIDVHPGNRFSLSGVTLTHGLVDGFTFSGGAGLRSTGSDTRVVDCIISDNHAFGFNGRGGGILNVGNQDDQKSILILESTLVSENSAAVRGGGICAENEPTFDSRISLSVIGCEISGNRAVKDGGGIFLDRQIGLAHGTIHNSTISGNVSMNDGGGVYFRPDSGSISTISSSTISNNVADGSGGGLSTRDDTLVVDCTISNNRIVLQNNGDGGGAGVALGGGATLLINSTISGNVIQTGGGIGFGAGVMTFFRSGAQIRNCTITKNVNRSRRIGSLGSRGGGIGLFAILPGPTGNAVIQNSIVAGNYADLGPDIFREMLSLGSNLIGNSDDALGLIDSDIVDVPALLGPLMNHGGPTMTHALLPDSPAVGAGNNGAITEDLFGPEPTDQRGVGFPRIVGKRVDIGAFEGTTDICEIFPAIDSQFDQLSVAFGMYGDFSGDALPAIASLRLIEAAACLYAGPVRETMNAFEVNLSRFDAEGAASRLLELREVISMLMLVSVDTQARTREIFREYGIFLLSPYAVVSCLDPDSCMPSAVPGAHLLDAYEEFVDPRSVDEPYSAEGDIDGDGVSNLQEYLNVLDRGGTVDDFAAFALDPALDGTEFVARGTGGGSGGGCFIATAAYGTPLAEDIDALRGFRDAYLMNNAVGAALADAYYRVSPSLADEVAASRVLAGAVRLGIVVALMVGAMWPWLGLGLGAMLAMGWLAGRRRQMT